VAPDQGRSWQPSAVPPGGGEQPTALAFLSRPMVAAGGRDGRGRSTLIV
jgi:hypothetical protein